MVCVVGVLEVMVLVMVVVVEAEGRWRLCLDITRVRRAAVQHH